MMVSVFPDATLLVLIVIMLRIETFEKLKIVLGFVSSLSFRYFSTTMIDMT